MDENLEQRIRERAYEIWENEGRPEGRGDEHWDQARMEYAEARDEQAQTAGSPGQVSQFGAVSDSNGEPPETGGWAGRGEQPAIAGATGGKMPETGGPAGGTTAA